MFKTFIGCAVIAAVSAGPSVVRDAEREVRHLQRDAQREADNFGRQVAHAEREIRRSPLKNDYRELQRAVRGLVAVGHRVSRGVMNKPWFRSGSSMIARFDREQNSLRRRQEHTAQKWHRKNGRQAAKDIDAAFRTFDAHAKPILSRLERNTRKAQRWGQQMTRKTERASRAAQRAFDAEFR